MSAAALEKISIYLLFETVILLLTRQIIQDRY